MKKYWIVWNDTLPLKGFKAMALWPWIFVRNGVRFTICDRNHECIHLRQQLEMLMAGAVLAAVLWLAGCGWWSLLALGLFFWWYALEWTLRLPFSGIDRKKAYKSILFEQEAYANQDDQEYLGSRRWFAWITYMKRNKQG